MDLPRVLRQRLDDALTGASASELRAAATRLSNRYRGEVRDGRMHLESEAAVLAYLASRLPATYAAIRAALDAVVVARPSYAPKTALDLGAGPGTGLWALADRWPDIGQVTLVEQSGPSRAWGERLATGAALPKAIWRSGDIGRVSEPKDADIVLLGYVLGEIAEAGRFALIERAWSAARDTLLVVEPGTSAGWARVLAVRTQLVAMGAHILAPCPHSRDCPLQPPDWCHFSERIPRSRLHRELKGGELGWEDEKFFYLAASRHKPAVVQASRIIARPVHAKGRVTLKLCNPDGHATDTIISRRDGDLFKRARRAEWGDVLSQEIDTHDQASGVEAP